MFGWLTAILLFLGPRHAIAYIDPGTGSIVFQVVLAAVLGVSFLLKTFWRRIKGLWSSPANQPPDEEEHREK